MGKQLHHIPPTDSTNIPRWHGLAILMDKSDHARLTSTGNGLAAQEHREDIEDLIHDGEWREAVNCEIADIQHHCGDKYDEAIRQALHRAGRSWPD